MNKKSPFYPLIFFGIGICFASLPLLITYFFSHTDSELHQAEKAYQQGENSSVISARMEAFNRALSIYTALEKENHPINGNGKLYYNIGNTYFQLEEYPLAIFYYYQAHALMPQSEAVIQNLNIALEKQKLPLLIANSFPKLLFFHYVFSLPQRYQLFSGATLVTFFLSSAWIWLRSRYLKWCISASLIISIVFFLSICYSQYLAPAEGVVIEASGLYRDAGMQYAKVREEPIRAGTKVEVIAIEQHGLWLKILTADGVLGYIPQKNLRLLEN